MLSWLFYFFFVVNIANSLDIHLISTSLNLSQSSYCVSKINQWNCISCNPEINNLDVIIETRGTRVLMGYNKDFDSIFISYRGSSDILNWIDNLHFNKIKPYLYYSEVEVEKGFYQEFNSSYHDIKIELPKLVNKYNNNKLLITGHSAGASMGTLLYFQLIYDSFYNYQFPYLVTFGSPRVGNKEFVNRIINYQKIKDTISYRVTHYYDMVPHVPQEFLNYNHIPNEIWYNEPNSKYKICDDLNGNEDDSCSNSCSPTHCTSIDDHLYYLNISMGSDGNC